MSVTSVLGCEYAYEAAEAIVINGANQYHGVSGLQQDGCNLGTTFLASATGAVTDTADNASILRCTSVAHGLATGQYLSLTGPGDAAHAGLTRVTVISVDLFDCDDIAYSSAEDTKTWTRGASIKIDVGRGGFFWVSFSTSLLSAGVNKNYKFEVAKNAVEQDTIVSERKISVSNDLGSMSSGGTIKLSSNDTVWMIVKNTTDSTNLTIEHMNLHLARV